MKVTPPELEKWLDIAMEDAYHRPEHPIRKRSKEIKKQLMRTPELSDEKLVELFSDPAFDTAMLGTMTHRPTDDNRVIKAMARSTRKDVRLYLVEEFYEAWISDLLVKDPDPDVRAQAAANCSERRLQDLASDPDRHVRESAIERYAYIDWLKNDADDRY